MNILDSAKNTDQIKYSVDVKELLADGSIPKVRLNNYLEKFLRGDFGSVENTKAQRFAKHLDQSDLDIYGIYDDIMIYYDAQFDDITFVTPEEFRNFYKADWDNANRAGYAVRYGAARQDIRTPGKIVKRNQIEAVLEQLKKELGSDTKVATLARIDYKIYPHTKLTSVAKELRRTTTVDEEGNEVNAMDFMKALSAKYNVNIVQLLQLFANQHYVQHKTTEASIQYVKRAAASGAAALGAKDALPEEFEDFTTITAQKYPIVEVWENENGRKFVIVDRKVDFALGAGYDVRDGQWNAGYYGYESAIDARQAMYREYPYNEFKRSSL